MDLATCSMVSYCVWRRFLDFFVCFFFSSYLDALKLFPMASKKHLFIFATTTLFKELIDVIGNCQLHLCDFVFGHKKPAVSVPRQILWRFSRTRISTVYSTVPSRIGSISRADKKIKLGTE